MKHHYSIVFLILMNQSAFGLILTDKQQELADAIKNPSSKIVRFIELVDKTELNKPCTKLGRYPVHLVAMRKKLLYTDVMMCLLYKCGADTDIKDSKNKTALAYAIEMNNKRLIDLLIAFRSANAPNPKEIKNANGPADEYCAKYSNSLKKSKKKRRLSILGSFRKLTL